LDLRDPFIEYQNEHATTFIHSSQPATPVLNAALVSLDVHDRDAEVRRRASHAAVERFRAGLVSIGQPSHAGTSFPIQSVMIASPALALDLATALPPGTLIWQREQSHCGAWANALSRPLR
jgi:7-keto-8-aminopelargonate synthetase-like enzyme